MAEMNMVLKIEGLWQVEGFEPMTTAEFSKLLARIDAAQFHATLAEVKQSEPTADVDGEENGDG